MRKIDVFKALFLKLYVLLYP